MPRQWVIPDGYLEGKCVGNGPLHLVAAGVAVALCGVTPRYLSTGPRDGRIKRCATCGAAGRRLVAPA